MSVDGLWSEAVARKCSLKKGVVENFTKFTGKQLCQSLSFDKLEFHFYFHLNFISNIKRI